MPRVTVDLSEETMAAFEERARKESRTPADAITSYLEAVVPRSERRTSLRDLVPLNLGEVLVPFTSKDELLGEMLDG